MSSFGGSIKLEGASEYKKALSDITQNLKVVSAEMKATTSSADKENMSEKELTAMSKQYNSVLDQQKTALANAKIQLDNLQKQYANNKSELDKLNKEYDDEKKKLEEIGRTLGTSSDEYKKQEDVVAKLEAEVVKSEKALDSQGRVINDMRIKTANAEATINQTAKSVDKLGEEEEETAKQTEKSGDGFTVLKGVLANLASQAITSVINGMKKLASSVKETVLDVTELGDEIDKESQKLGMSAETYQKLSYAMESSGADIDSFKKGVININSTLANVENGVEGASDKFDALGVSLQNADGSMKSTEDVLLSSIDALASMEDETQRNALANDIFGKSYTELAPLLNEGSEGIKSLMQEAEDYGMVLSDDVVKASADFDDSLTRLNGSVNGLKSRLVGQLLPSFGEVVDGLSLMASGSEEGGKKLSEGIKHAIDDINRLMPEFIKTGGEILKGIITGISENLDSISQSSIDLIQTLATALIDNLPTITSAIGESLPTLIETLVTLVIQLIENLDQILEPILDALPQIITTVLDALANHIGEIVSGLVSVVVMILDHLPEIIKAIIEAVPDIIVELIKAIVENLPTLILAIIDCVVEIGKTIWEELGNVWDDYISPWLDDVIKNVGEFFSNIWEDIKTWFNDTINNIGEFFNDIWNDVTEGLDNIINEVKNFVKKIPEKIAEGFENIKEAGKNLVEGLWNGINDAKEWVLEKIRGFGTAILDGIKNFFGIKSPSKLFEEEVGKNLALGIGEGFSDEMRNVTADMNKAIPTSFDMNMNGTGGFGAITLNIYGAEGQDVNILADIVIDKLQRTITGSEMVYA